MPYGTRYTKGLRIVGRTVAKTDNYTITDSDLKKYDHFTMTADNKTFTLPVVTASMAGKRILITGTGASTANNVTVAAGFFGGGASYDTVALTKYGSAEFYCDGTYWYAITAAQAT